MDVYISKSEFEEIIPVGTTPQDDIFEMVAPTIHETVDRLRLTLLGAAGEARAESNESVMRRFKRVVCIQAFLSVFRHLDVVLTGSGFGVVSDSNLSPASKERVNALYSSLQTQEIQEREYLLKELFSEEWGMTMEAAEHVPYVFTALYFFKLNPLATHEDWKKAQMQLPVIDGKLREIVSSELMDDLLQALRCADGLKLLAYAQLAYRMVRFFHCWLSGGGGKSMIYPYRELMKVLESPENREAFDLYYSSTAYANNHHEGYENTKESPAFIFLG